MYPRRTFLARRKAGRADEPQLVAANVDVVFVITAATGEHNLRRLERYVAAVHAGGAVPEIVLNKVDLVADTAPFLAAMPRGVRVHALSALHGSGIDSLEIGSRRTYAFVGSSGVGKSTIVNRLLGAEQQVVQSLARDDTGRHPRRTASSSRCRARAVDHRHAGDARARDVVGGGSRRDLLRITALAERCKFRDCGHDTEPGCAVMAAIADGSLEEDRLHAWRKLLREARRVTRSQVSGLRSQRKRGPSRSSERNHWRGDATDEP